MKREYIYFAVAAVAAMCGGCGDRNAGLPEEPDNEGTAAAVSGAKRSVAEAGKDGAAAKRSPKKSAYPIDDLAPGTVVARVDGTPILQSDYMDWYRLRDRMYRVANGIPFDEKSDRTRSYAQNSRMLVPTQLVRRALVKNEAAKLGIKPGEAEMRKAEKRYMATIKRKGKPFSSVGGILGLDDISPVKSAIESEVLSELVLIASSTNNLKSVSDADVDARMKWIKEWNERADATNAVQRARAEQAKKDILGGGIFADIASNRSDKAKNEGTQWLIYDIQEALDESEEFGAWLAASRQGDISDPIELEDGLSVIGVVNIVEDGDAKDGDKPQKQYELVRCLFDVYETLDEPESREELAKGMLAERKNAAMRELGERLTADAKIEFPLGDGIFARRKAKKAPAKNKTKKSARPDGSSGKDKTEGK